MPQTPEAAQTVIPSFASTDSGGRMAVRSLEGISKAAVDLIEARTALQDARIDYDSAATNFVLTM